jgi:(1->4)-alpha-D-glucan 1-alpha-D-glucosylmutase
VDFAARAVLLAGLRERMEAGGLPELARELVENWPDGRIKLYAIHRALTCRRRLGDIFQSGAYVPLSAGGDRALHVCAFARHGEHGTALTLVPRLTASLTDNGARLPLGREVWGDTWLRLPWPAPPDAYVNRLTGTEVTVAPSDDGPILHVGDVLKEFPVALLETGPSAPGRDATGTGA